jgi:ribosomal protein S18 acetylase RimI-like enzyme
MSEALVETPRVEVAKVEERLRKRELAELCDAAAGAISDGAGFGWVRPPPPDAFERYWRGVTVVPERVLFLGRLDGVIAGSVQLVSPPPQKEAWAPACLIDTHFVAPWARGHGLAKALLDAVEQEAVTAGFKVMNLSVRETQDVAIKLYESLGFRRWGTHPKYAFVDGKSIAGHYYCKDL